MGCVQPSLDEVQMHGCLVPCADSSFTRIDAINSMIMCPLIERNKAHILIRSAVEKDLEGQAAFDKGIEHFGEVVRSNLEQ